MGFEWQSIEEKRKQYREGIDHHLKVSNVSRYYLVSYAHRSHSCGFSEWRYFDELVEGSLLEWRIEQKREYPKEDHVIVNVIEITKEEYERYRDSPELEW